MAVGRPCTKICISGRSGFKKDERRSGGYIGGRCDGRLCDPGGRDRRPPFLLRLVHRRGRASHCPGRASPMGVGRNLPFRIVHVASVVLVAVESLAGAACPLDGLGIPASHAVRSARGGADLLRGTACPKHHLLRFSRVGVRGGLRRLCGGGGADVHPGAAGPAGSRALAGQALGRLLLPDAREHLEEQLARLGPGNAHTRG